MTAVVHVGDALAVLRTLPSDSVQACVTSPPYWKLRNYGVEGQAGLEGSPREYVAALVDVFREVRRVLRPDGAMWLNLGDTYASGGGAGWQGKNGKLADRDRPPRTAGRTAGDGIKPKDLVGIPWEVAFALRSDGWWLRRDQIWRKPNPRPESQKDRPTTSHEYVFLLTKSEDYFYDEFAIAEDATERDPGNVAPVKGSGDEQFRVRANLHKMTAQSTRTARSVWTIATQPFRGEHFAVMPQELARLCIVSITSDHGCCPMCGAPWRRVVQKGEVDRARQIRCGSDADGQYHGQAQKDFAGAGAEDASALKSRILAGMVVKSTAGWRRPCKCQLPVSGAIPEPIPCTVLDPFAGAGTTGVVAVRHGRSFVGSEINPKFAAMARRRITAEAPLFVRST